MAPCGLTSQDGDCLAGQGSTPSPPSKHMYQGSQQCPETGWQKHGAYLNLLACLVQVKDPAKFAGKKSKAAAKKGPGGGGG
jgi:hypothetical protein